MLIAAENTGILAGLPGWITALGVLFGLIVMVAAAFAVLLSAANKQRMQTLEDTNRTLTERVNILESEATRKDAEHSKEMAVVKAEKSALEEKVKVLERVVTGREQLEHLQSSLDAHDARVDTLGQNIANFQKEHLTHMDRIQKQLTSNRRLLTAIVRQLPAKDGTDA